MVSMKFEVADLFLWPMLRNIEPSLLRELDKFYVYNQGESVVLLTKSRRVYYYPYLTSTLEIKEHYEVNVDGGTVVQMDSSGFTLLLLTETGGLFVMGYCEYGQLGLGKQRREAKGKLLKQGIRLVRCGDLHVLALAIDGSVYAWGCNQFHQLGLEETEAKFVYNQSDPFLWKPTLVPSLVNLDVVDLQCDQSDSMAITRSGGILVWGGVWNLRKPTRLFLPFGSNLLQVSLASSVVVALTHDGQCYLINPIPYHISSINLDSIAPHVIDATGLCRCFAMTRVTFSRHLPFIDDVYLESIVQFGTPLEPILNLATVLDNPIAVLQSVTGQTYLLNLVSNMATPIDSVATVADVFALYGTSHDIHRLISIPECLTLPDPTMWRITFNNPNFYCQDLKIKISSNRQTIYVSYPFLRQRVPNFAKLYDVTQKEYQSLRVFLNVSYAALFAFVRYVYTNEAWIHIDWAVDLHHLSCIFNVPTLRDRCIDFLCTETTSQKLLYALEWNRKWIRYPIFVKVILSHLQIDNCVQWYSFVIVIEKCFWQNEAIGSLVDLHFGLARYLHEHIEQIVRLDPLYRTMPIILWRHIFVHASQYIFRPLDPLPSSNLNWQNDYYF